MSCGWPRSAIARSMAAMSSTMRGSPGMWFAIPVRVEHDRPRGICADATAELLARPVEFGPEMAIELRGAGNLHAIGIDRRVDREQLVAQRRVPDEIVIVRRQDSPLRREVVPREHEGRRWNAQPLRRFDGLDRVRL